MLFIGFQFLERLNYSNRTESMRNLDNVEQQKMVVGAGRRADQGK